MQWQAQFDLGQANGELLRLCERAREVNTTTQRMVRLRAVRMSKLCKSGRGSEQTRGKSHAVHQNPV
jgi:hypothetical protein